MSGTVVEEVVARGGTFVEEVVSGTVVEEVVARGGTFVEE